MRRLTWAVPAAFLLVHGLEAPRAHACSAPPECPQRTTVVPFDGSTGVPTNTEIQVSYYIGCRGWFCEGARTRVRLRAEGGEDVALGTSSTTGRMRPAVELAPGTAYEIVDLDYASSGSCREGDAIPEIVIARFTTGAGPDLVAPSVPTGLRTGGCSAERCDSSACCGPYDASSNSVAWEPSTDDGDGLIGYLHSGGGEPHYGAEMHVHTFSSSWPGAHYPYPLGSVRLGTAPGRRRFVVSAVDLAGNVSAASEPIEIDLTCVLPEDAGTPDAGTPAMPDAARARDAGPRADTGAGGAPPPGGGSCSASHARPTQWWTFIGACVLLAFARSRRLAGSRQQP